MRAKVAEDLAADIVRLLESGALFEAKTGPRPIGPGDIAVLVRPAADGLFGAKGPGEMCANPQIPAVANAIFNAVGVRIDDLPITPEKVLRAIKAQGGARPQARR